MPAVQWMPRESWDALVRGEGCPLCGVLASTEGDQHGFFVADLPSGRLRLARDQLATGYCLLISKTHVREPYELLEDERLCFFADMCRIGAALEKLFDAAKMNFEILGNSVPHLHAHIRPRFYGDPAPGRPLRSSDGEVFLTEPEYRERVELIRKAVAAEA